MSRTATSLIGAAGLVLIIAGCIPFPGQTPTTFVAAEKLLAETVVAAADFPSALAFAADGRVFYTEKNTGRIRVVSAGQLLVTPFAEVPVNSAGDRGLLGIALHPDFDTNGRVYVFYSRSDTGATTSDPQAILDHRIVYFEAGGDVALGGEVFVASIPGGARTERVGGRIAFALDGTLMATVGDLRDPDGAQDAAALNGKLLRFNDDGSIPADNPVAGSAVYASGFRFPTGVAADPLSDASLVADVNESGSDEINRAAAGSNHGWPSVIGVAAGGAELTFVGMTPSYVDPLIDTRSDRVHPVGAGFNPSARYGSDLMNDFFYGERNGRRVMRVRLTSSRTAVAFSSPFAAGFPAPISDVAFTPAGTLYVACDNAIYRLVPIR